MYGYVLLNQTVHTCVFVVGQLTDAGWVSWLQKELERQALEKYLTGDYTLGKLDRYGQRISIRVTIPRKKGIGDVSFITGWMAEPNGKLRLTTPYGGK